MTQPLTSRSISESESKRTLHDSRGPCGGRLAERRVGLLSRGVEGGGRVDAAELRVVKEIVELPAELDAAPVALHGEVLEQRDVPVVDSRAAYDSGPDTPRVAARRTSEDRGVEHPVEAALAVGDARVADEIGANAVAAADEICVV